MHGQQNIKFSINTAMKPVFADLAEDVFSMLA
jgi:hypothetical protein